MRPLDVEGVEQPDGLADPRVHVIADALGTLGEAESYEVRCDDTQVLRQGGDRETPVGVRRHARP